MRWLLAKGRLDEAVTILNKMARWNRITPPPGGFVPMEEEEKNAMPNDDQDNETSDSVTPRVEEKKSCTYLDVLRSRRLLLNTVIIYFSW